MAFNGNLHEFGIVALLQLPNTNRLTGMLVVHGKGGEARFFYRKGRLVHAAAGQREGRDALAAVIDWDEGRFSFESDEETTQESIREDLHHTLMWALKERDERKKREEEERQALELQRQREAAERPQTAAPEVQPEPESEPEPEPEAIPQDILEAAPHASYACLLNSGGFIVAETQVEADYRKGIDGYLKAVRSFAKTYPGDSVGKTFIDDPEFSLGLAGNGNGFTAVLFASPNTRLGILSMELGKFMARLTERGFGAADEGRSS